MTARRTYVANAAKICLTRRGLRDHAVEGTDQELPVFPGISKAKSVTNVLDGAGQVHQLDNCERFH